MRALFIGLAFNFALSSPVWGQELLVTIPIDVVGDGCFNYDFPVPSEITYYLGHNVIDTLVSGPSFHPGDFFWVQRSLPLGQLGSVDVSTGVDFDRLVTLLTNGASDSMDTLVNFDNRPYFGGNMTSDTELIAGKT